MPVLKALWAGSSATLHVARNLAFRALPGVSHGLLRLANVTGRGAGREGSSAADYFSAVVGDYEAMAEYTRVSGEGGLFRGRRVLELGLGNTRSVALLGRLKGAEQYAGFDPFDVQSRDRAYLSTVYEPLLERHREPGGMARAEALLSDVPVHTTREALLSGGRRFDLVLSRAVLEHVSDLEGLFRDLAAVTVPGAVHLHKVDLRSHGNQWDHELDFLLFPEGLYRAMASHTGLPNRVRVDGYLDLVRRHGLALLHASATRWIEPAAVEALRPRLPPSFREKPASVLSVLGVWLVLVGPEHPLAPRGITALDAEALPRAPAERLSVY